ncbi:hypothetical protein DV738_g3912, partial [Chaetothyriales sp. CBS 135597]
MAGLGYIGGADHFNVPQSIGRGGRIAIDRDQLVNRPNEIPNRSMTDKLVHEYLNNFNYHYYCTYPPAFLREYAEWWNITSSGRPVSMTFTALLLQIPSLAVQFVGEETRREIEYELGESVQILTEKYNAAADKLSREIGPGQGGLRHVEQLFLSACWLKAEARFVESWHALGKTIREAQEQGLHQDQEEGPGSVAVTEWHSALRRRMWCILYVWDWYMAGWLGRPAMIDHAKAHDHQVDTDMLTLSASSTDPDPFHHIYLQYKLVQAVSRHYAKYNSTLNPSALVELQRIFDDWQDKLPPYLKLESEESSLVVDTTHHKFILSQRLQLHACVSVMRLNPLKAYLVNPITTTSTGEETQLRESAVTYTLALLSTSQSLFNLGVDAKDHLVAFCLFDTGAVACSAIMHGVAKAVGREDELRDAIDTTLVRLSGLSHISKPAAKSYRVLARLVRRLPPPSASASASGSHGTPVAAAGKKIKTQAAASSNSSSPPPAPSSLGSSILPAAAYTQSRSPDTWPSASDDNNSHDTFLLPWVVPNDLVVQPRDDEDNTGAEPPPSLSWTIQHDNEHQLTNLDYGGFEQLWNWQDLNLDPYSGLPTLP